jgi:hypothetical protein
MLSPRLRKLLPLGAVVAIALASCVQLFIHHRCHYRERWVGAGHDRNAHYRYGLQMAADVENGDLPRYVWDLDSGSWVWPPLNGLLVAAVALVAGRDPVTAILPSLTGWFLTVVFAYLLAERASNRFGVLAGFLAAACALVSPAHRAYATDVMMESLGAGLTLAALYAFVVWSQEHTRRSGAWLGLALTLLFFEKYNYWLLVAVAVLPVHAYAHRSEYLELLKRLRVELPWRSWLFAQFRRPLNYPIAALLAVIAAIALTAGFDIDCRGERIEVRTNQVFVAAAYGLILLRFAFWWWTGGRHLVRARSPEHVYPLIYWHIFPVLTWFVIPYRLRTFLWFVSPANTEGEYHATFADGVRFFWAGAEGEYVAAPDTLAWLAVGMVLAAVMSRTLRPAGWVVPLFALLALFLTCKHPNHKLRFLHTGMAGAYVAGAVGFAGLLGLLPRNRAMTIASITALLVALAAILWTGRDELTGSGHASEAGLNGRGRSIRAMGDAVAPLIREGEPTAVFSDGPSKFWATWMYLERFRAHDKLQVDCRQVEVLGPPTPEEFAAWCAKTDCRAVIFVSIPPNSPLFEAAPPSETAATVLGLLPHSPFRLAQTMDVPECGTITVWRK